MPLSSTSIHLQVRKYFIIFLLITIITFRVNGNHDDDYCDTRHGYACIQSENYILKNLCNFFQLHYFCPRKSNLTVSQGWLFYCWRHAPDILTISCSLLTTTVGHLDTVKEINLVAFVGLHWIVLALIIVNFLQVGSARFNLTRYFLETPVLNTLGYCSYSLYLFQRPVFEYYIPGIKNMR